MTGSAPSGLDRNKDPHITGVSEAPLHLTYEVPSNAAEDRGVVTGLLETGSCHRIGDPGLAELIR